MEVLDELENAIKSPAGGSAPRNHEGTGRYSGGKKPTEATPAAASTGGMPQELKAKMEAMRAGSPTGELAAPTEPVDVEGLIGALSVSSLDPESLAAVLEEFGITAEEALNIYPIGEEGGEELISALQGLAKPEATDLTPPVGLHNIRSLGESGFIPD
jgi:hypothetical protein